MYSIPTIGAYKVAHSLRKNGYSCLVINHFSFYTDEEFAKIIDLAVSDKTKLIGFSNSFLRTLRKEEIILYSDLDKDTIFPQGKESENKFIELCKQKNKNIKTVIGGSKTSRHYKNKNIDYVCIGYSEESIINLMNHLVNDEPLKNSVKNIWGRIVIDDPKQKSYDFANSSFEWRPEDVFDHKVLPLETARGCIFQCKFCAFPMNGKQNLDFVKEENLLYNELVSNYERFGITHYQLIDDTFNDHEQKINMMSRIVKKLPFQPTFWGYHRLDLLTTRPGTIDQLYDMGVRGMFFGIESLNPTTAKIVGKGFNIDKQIETIHRIREKYDISMHGSFIIGLPEESIESSLATYNKIRSGDIPLHSWSFNPLWINKFDIHPFPSEFDKNWKNYGYEEIEEDLNVNSKTIQGAELFSPALNWKNSKTNFTEATHLANQISSENIFSNSMHIDSQVAIGIHSMGFSNFTFDIIRKSIQKDFNLHVVETVLHKQFIKQSKKKLFDFLTNMRA